MCYRLEASWDTSWSSSTKLRRKMSMGYIPVVVVMMHHYDHEAGRPTMTMRLVWCGVVWCDMACCGVLWRGVVWFCLVWLAGCRLWVSTVGSYSMMTVSA